MEKQLYPYQFNYIKERVAHLVNAYNSVNDPNTIASIKDVNAMKYSIHLTRETLQFVRMLKSS